MVEAVTTDSAGSRRFEDARPGPGPKAFAGVHLRRHASRWRALSGRAELDACTSLLLTCTSECGLRRAHAGLDASQHACDSHMLARTGACPPARSRACFQQFVRETQAA